MSDVNNEASRNDQETDAKELTSAASQGTLNAGPDGDDFDDNQDFGSGDLSDRRHRNWSQAGNAATGWDRSGGW